MICELQLVFPFSSAMERKCSAIERKWFEHWCLSAIIMDP